MEPSLKYLAGFFDGEGNVGIYAGGGTGRTLRAQVTQADSPLARELLSSLQTRWGGSLCMFNKSLRRPAWNYQVGGQGAAALMRDLRPHLILKAEQVDVALRWFDSRPARQRDPRTGHHLPRSVGDVQNTEAAADLLRALKR